MELHDWWLAIWFQSEELISHTAWNIMLLRYTQLKVEFITIEIIKTLQFDSCSLYVDAKPQSTYPNSLLQP